MIPVRPRGWKCLMVMTPTDSLMMKEVAAGSRFITRTSNIGFMDRADVADDSEGPDGIPDRVFFGKIEK